MWSNGKHLLQYRSSAQSDTFFCIDANKAERQTYQPMTKRYANEVVFDCVQKSRHSSRDVFLRKQSRPPLAKESLSQPYRNKLLPAPWGQNPFKFPWIGRDQWYAEAFQGLPNATKASVEGRHWKRRPTWGLDAVPEAPSPGSRVPPS